MPYKSDFNAVPWKTLMAGVRHKVCIQGGIRLRLVEYSKEMPVHRCEKGHHGFVVSGSMEITFNGCTEIYSAGDGIVIPNGPEHRHSSRLLTDKAVVFFVEQE